MRGFYFDKRVLVYVLSALSGDITGITSPAKYRRSFASPGKAAGKIAPPLHSFYFLRLRLFFRPPLSVLAPGSPVWNPRSKFQMLVNAAQMPGSTSRYCHSPRSRPWLYATIQIIRRQVSIPPKALIGDPLETKIVRQCYVVLDWRDRGIERQMPMARDASASAKTCHWWCLFLARSSFDTS